MKKATLPVEKASEPNEGARQPMLASQNSLSQTSSILTQLSQPAPELSHRARLEWLQARRRPGLWAQCDACARWRYLPAVSEPLELPDKWYCKLNPDPAFADCSVPEKPIRVRLEEDLIHGEYAAGSVVWARMPGYPWWPAMVCDCPDTEQYYWLDGFSDIPTHYNVVFFDEADVTRAWIAAGQIKPYAGQKKQFEVKNKKYKSRINTAIKLANDAKNLDLAERLSKFSFISVYKGPINSPKVNKKEINKQQRKLKKKLQINLEHDSDSDMESFSEKRMKKNDVKIIVGSRSPDKKARLANNKEIENLKKKDKTLKHDKNLVKPTSKDETDENKKNDPVTNTVATPESSKAKKPYFPSKNKGKTSIGDMNKKTLTVKFFEDQVLGAESQDTKTISQEKDNETTAVNESAESKYPSLAVQVGSKDSPIQNSLLVESFDNDTSKTYVPGPESTETTEYPDSQGSDDFEY